MTDELKFEYMQLTNELKYGDIYLFECVICKDKIHEKYNAESIDFFYKNYCIDCYNEK